MMMTIMMMIVFIIEDDITLRSPMSAVRLASWAPAWRMSSTPRCLLVLILLNSAN